MYTKSLLISLIGVAAADHFNPHAFCQKLCYETKECREDPHAHGSYCKIDHHPATCFGLYEKKHHHHHEYKFCFEPNSRHCNDAELKPVLCHKRHHEHREDRKLEEQN